MFTLGGAACGSDDTGAKASGAGGTTATGGTGGAAGEAGAAGAAGCDRDDPTYQPTIDPADFTTTIDNPFFPLIPGTTMTFEGDGETIVVEVTAQTREVMKVTCVVVHDSVSNAGELIEDTFDWYAQDLDGNVWYFGEDSKEYVNGNVVSTAGSWEGGVNNARPGIIMLASPAVGEIYRQEFLACEAEDMAEVVAVDEAVTVPAGSFTGCIKTRDYTPLAPISQGEYKVYCPDVGTVLESDAATDVRLSELMKVVGP